MFAAVCRVLCSKLQETCCSCCVSKRIPWEPSQCGSVQLINQLLHEDNSPVHLAPDVDVATVEVCRFAASDAGYLSDIALIKLTYTGQTDLPDSMLAKLTPSKTSARLMGPILQLFSSELLSYQRNVGCLSDGTQIFRMPDMYGGRVDRAGRFIILLQNLEHLQAADQQLGIPHRQFVMLVQQLGGLHAAHWNRTRTPQLSFLRRMDDTAYYTLVQKEFATGMATWRQQRERCDIPVVDDGSALEAYASAVEFIQKTYTALFSSLVGVCSGGTLPVTFTHGDIRPPNVLFSTEAAAADALAIIDFQTVREAHPASDLGYCLATCIPPTLIDAPERHALIVDVLRAYVGALRAGGVSAEMFPMADLLVALPVWLCMTSGIMSIITYRDLDHSKIEQVQDTRAWAISTEFVFQDLDVVSAVRNYMSRLDGNGFPPTVQAGTLSLEAVRASVPLFLHVLLEDEQGGDAPTDTTKTVEEETQQ